MKALDGLPSWVSAPQRGWAEEKLVRHARTQDPSFVALVGKAVADKLNPDGVFEDCDRAAKRDVRLGRQGRDGMSTLTATLTPEARAYLEAISAAVRPGHHVPGAEQTVVDATSDARTPGQRLHAALVWGTLGTRRGLPVTVIVKATVHDFQQAAQACGDPGVPMPPPATTAGGSKLPYLAIFDGHSNRPLYLGRGPRIASADQWIICPARDRGCIMLPAGCPAAPVMPTDCFSPANRTTRLKPAATTPRPSPTAGLAWSDGTGPPEINRIHHPEELLADNGDDDP